MNFQKLKKLNSKLKQTYEDYISMIAVGSIVTEDPHIKNRSDNDIVLIFEKVFSSRPSNIEDILSSFDFDESYVFTPLPKSEFGIPFGKYSFSNKFRSKNLFGKDLIKKAKLPNYEQSKKIYLKGLNSTIHQVENNLTNSKIWDIDKIKDKFWKQFKHAFMYLAIREYCLSGEYPKTRKEITTKINMPKLKETFEVLHNINNKSHVEITNCSKKLSKMLHKFISQP